MTENCQKLDGLEVLAQIKSDSELRRLLVAVLTSFREDQDLIKSDKLGINTYVVKPVDCHESVNTIKKLGRFWAVVNQPPLASLLSRRI